ncbi:3111_t:CDS:1, partial [Ambispora gerdemannii]
MSSLSPVHLTGISNNASQNIETQNCVPSQQEFNETSPGLVSKRTRAFTPDEESQDSDSEHPSTRQTKEKNKRRISFATESGTPSGHDEWLSLPHQNLDASRHAPYYSPTPFPPAMYGNFPPYPHYSPFHMYNYGNGNYNNSPNPESNNVVDRHHIRRSQSNQEISSDNS